MVSNRKQEIDRLVSCFGAGDLAQAEQIARRLLAADRQDEEALHLLAQICYRRGRAEESVTLMKELLGLNPAHAPYNNDYGVMLASLGRWDEAATAYGVAVVLDQRNVDARFNLALALFRTKQKDRARVELDRLMALRADLPEAVALNGELLRDEGRPTEAIEAFMQAIELGMETSDVYVNLGLALEDMNRGDEAAQALHKANRLDDGDAAACFHLGNFYRNKGNKDQAEKFFSRAVSLRPDFAEAHNNLGLLLQENGEAARAAACFEKALSKDPDMDAAHTNLGSSRLRQGWMDGAIDSFRRAIDINPQSAEAWNNLGNVYFRLHRLGEAEAAYRRSLDIRPSYVEADLNLGILLLLRGNLPEGWPRYESRWSMPGVAEKRPKFKQPEWEGDPLSGRTLLVYSEQGMGDNLQFVRYLPLLRERYPDSKIYFWCLPPLYRLFRSCAETWGIEALPPTVAGGLPPIDLQIALLSLPYRMGTELSSIPANVPYIWPESGLVEKWSSRLAELPGKKVGVVWASGEIYAFHKFRTVRLKQLEPLLNTPGISWVSLQKGSGAEQIVSEGLSGKIVNLMDEVEDFADTAAIMAGLDLVVSVDTSVPHLAGAMGVPVWLLDRFDTDWRWLLDRADSPWYPTMRIFRQTSFGDWPSAMDAAAAALAEWVSNADGGEVCSARNAAPVPAARIESVDEKALKLNLGCGNRKMDGFLNVDCVEVCQPDLVVNLERTPWPWPDNSVDEIKLIHVLEHLGQQTDVFLAIIKEMYRVCRDAARIEIIVPHPRSDTFLGDPTHVRPVTGAMLNLFSKRLNREWAEMGAANTPLGIILDVDFEIDSFVHTLEPEWQGKLSSGQLSEAEVAQAARQYNNVISQSTIVWRVRKPT